MFSDNNQSMYLTDKKSKILVLLNVTSNEKVTYECEAKNYYHKMYSTYTLNIVGMITLIVFDLVFTVLPTFLNSFS